MADDVEALRNEVSSIRGDVTALNRSMGKVEGIVEGVAAHLVRQDAATETNKAAAIKARGEKESRDEARFNVLDQKATLTGGRVSVLEKAMDEDVKPMISWWHEEGAKLGGRVSVLEQAKIAAAVEKAQADNVKAGEDGEARGFWRSWGLISAGFVALFGLIGWLGKDALAVVFDRLARALGN